MWKSGMQKEEEPAGGSNNPAAVKWSAGKTTFEGVPDHMMAAYLSAGRQQETVGPDRSGRDPRGNGEEVPGLRPDAAGYPIPRGHNEHYDELAADRDDYGRSGAKREQSLGSGSRAWSAAKGERSISFAEQPTTARTPMHT